MIQYERRFVELYELVADKLVETRKYYDLYNTLTSSHRCMANEVSLLDSISAGFPQAQKSKGGKMQFSQSFAEIIESVDNNLEVLRKEYEEERSEVEK